MNGRYRLLLGLGRGGMAQVYLGVAQGLAGWNKLVVVKRLLPAMAADPDFCAMFTQEARLAARLNHPNVVQTYEIGESDDGMFLAMEYLEGQPLSRLARALRAEERRLHPSTCIRIACAVLAGLHHAHELKDFDGTPLRVVHRDVSPQNIFVTYQGHVKLLDFGIAKAERTSTKTQPGWLKGKYAYMAPEQFLGGDVDRRVDVFTTATVLWEMLAGRQLFARENEAMTVKSLVTEPVPRLATEVPSIDAQLDAIVAKGLEREPDDRYASALEMKEALEDVLARLGQHEDLGGLVSDKFTLQRREIETQISALLGDSANMSAAAPLPASVTSLRAVTSPVALPPPSAGGSFSVHHPVAHTAAPSRPDFERDTAVPHRFGLAGICAAGAALVIGTLMIARAISGPARAPEAPPPIVDAAPPPPVALPSTAASVFVVDPPAPIAREAAPVRTQASASAPLRWSPPTAKPAASPRTTASTTSSIVAAPPPPSPSAGTPAAATTATSTAPEGRRFRTTL